MRGEVETMVTALVFGRETGREATNDARWGRSHSAKNANKTTNERRKFGWTGKLERKEKKMET